MLRLRRRLSESAPAPAPAESTWQGLEQLEPRLMMSAAPAPVGFVEVWSGDIDATAPIVMTMAEDANVDAGDKFYAVAEGQFVLSNNSPGGDRYADAEYYQKTVGASDWDLGSKGKPLHITGLTEWSGGYQSDHVYGKMFESSNGDAITAQIIDPYYADNEGSLHVTLYQQIDSFVLSDYLCGDDYQVASTATDPELYVQHGSDSEVLLTLSPHLIQSSSAHRYWFRIEDGSEAGSFRQTDFADPNQVTNIVWNVPTGEQHTLLINVGIDYDGEGDIDDYEHVAEFRVQAERYAPLKPVGIKAFKFRVPAENASGESYVRDYIDSIKSLVPSDFSAFKSAGWPDRFDENFPAFPSQYEGAYFADAFRLDSLWRMLDTTYNNDSFHDAAFVPVSDPQWNWLLNSLWIPNAGASAGQIYHELLHARNDFAEQYEDADSDEGMGYTMQGITTWLSRMEIFDARYDAGLGLRNCESVRLWFTDVVGPEWNRMWQHAVGGGPIVAPDIIGAPVDVDGDEVADRNTTATDLARVEWVTGLDISASRYAKLLNSGLSAIIDSEEVNVRFTTSVQASPVIVTKSPGRTEIVIGLTMALPQELR